VHLLVVPCAWCNSGCHHGLSGGAELCVACVSCVPCVVCWRVGEQVGAMGGDDKRGQGAATGPHASAQPSSHTHGGALAAQEAGAGGSEDGWSSSSASSSSSSSSSSQTHPDATSGAGQAAGDAHQGHAHDAHQGEPEQGHMADAAAYSMHEWRQRREQGPFSQKQAPAPLDQGAPEASEGAGQASDASATTMSTHAPHAPQPTLPQHPAQPPHSTRELKHTTHEALPAPQQGW
jgi:hypothetical protein